MLVASAAFGNDELPGPSYTISVVLDPDRATLQAHQSLQMWNRSGGAIDHVDLHLHANAYRNGSTVFARDRRRSLAAYDDPRVAVPSEDSGGSIAVQSLRVNGRAARFVVDGTLLRVPLETPLPAGQGLLVELDFAVRIPRYRDRLAVAGSNFVIGAWFPKLAVLDERGWHSGQRRGLGEFFSETGDYDVSITVPQGFVVGATGSEVEHRTNANGTETSRWRAVRVRDFAWVADRTYRVSEDRWRGVTIRYLSLPGHEQAASGLKIAIEALDTFSNTFGEYPYNTFTVAEATAIKPGTGVEYPQFVLVSRDLAASAGFSSGFESILVHEIAHQWWYGVVGNNEVEEPWLDEALAAYSTRRYLRSKYGREPPMYRWPKMLGFLPSPTESGLARFMYASRARAGFDEPIDQPAPAFGDRPSYTASIYYKGAAVLEMLEYLVGTPAFERILRTYFAENAYRNARIADFIATAERTAPGLETFFAQWLEGSSTCDYSVDGINVKADESAIRLRRRGAIVMPVVVRATLEDGSHEDLNWDGRDAQVTLTLRSAAPVRSIRVDPDRRLLETDVENNHLPRRRVWSVNPLSMPDDAFSVAWLPFAWYGDSYGVGSLVAFGGPPEFGFPYGVRRRHGTSAVVRRNLKDDTTSLRVSYDRSLDLAASRGLVGATIGLRPGRETGGARFRWFIGKHFYQAPTHTIEISATHDREYVHPAADDDPPSLAGRHHASYGEASRTAFDAGTVRSITSRYVFNRLETDYFPVNGSLVDGTVEAGAHALGSDWSFVRATIRAETYLPLTSKSKLALAAAHGYATSGAPRQRAMLVTSDGGFVSTGLQQIAGRHMTAINAELRTSISGSSLAGAGFFSVAKYWPASRSSLMTHASEGWLAAGDTPDRVLSEAGVGLRLFDNAPFGIQIDWPLWVDTGRESRRFTARRLVLRVGRVFERD